MSKCKLFFILCFVVQLSFGQFNTLTFSVNKPKEETKKIDFYEKNKNTAEKKEEPKKKPKKRIKNTDLKLEIDSLKFLILKQNLTEKEQQFKKEKIKDSILTHQFKNEKKYQKFDLIKEEIESNSIGKVHPPMKNNLIVTSGFGGRKHPIFGVYKMHNGVDFKANNDDVFSVMDGIVTEAGWDFKGGGLYIKIKHYNKFETSYLHLSKTFFRAGDVVKAGYLIGKSGNTGNSTGEHLHFGVKENGNYINPIHFMNDLFKVNNLISTYYGK